MENNRLRLSGAVVIDKVSELLEAGRRYVSQSDLTLDCSAVETVDSSALALILDWRRSAEASGKKLAISGLPESLKTLADLYAVTDLIAATS
ncbi:MAG: STAS domain-containing protein [Burkholderiales bacterium]